jgi:uncharacterized protein YegP (UPF0339 family)
MNRVVRSLVLPLALAAAVAAAGPHAAGQDKTKAKAKGVAPPPAVETAVFELYKDSQGKFRFRLKEGDTELAMSHKGYETKADCQKVIDAIKSAAAKAKVSDESK